MITGPLRSQIDKLWEEFWTGGITNPLTVIEQISFLMFARLLDVSETRSEKKFARTHRGKIFSGELFAPDQQHLRWQNLRHEGDADKMLKLVRDELFPHMRKLGGRSTSFGRFLGDAQCMIQRASLLASAVRMIDKLPLTEGDTKGDLYEHMLGKLTTAGINGQFRTPRHIIRMMVELVDPKPTEVVGDPACGTAGFLVGTMEYLRERYTSPEGVLEHEENGKTYKTYTGDLLERHRAHIESEMFYGFDFDVTMLRISAMNMMLHGVGNPNIHYQDTLSNSFPERFPKAAEKAFDVVLANPPFKGSLDSSDVHRSLTGMVKTKKTELLFVALIHRLLKEPGGRAAVVVPDGVLFGSSKAHRDLRKMLLENCELQGVVSMPSGVFKPYASVSTAVLVFVRGGTTEDVWFYDMEADGYSLDDKRNKIDKTDIPDVIASWRGRDAHRDTDRKAKCFFVPAELIREADYDLSIDRYKEIEYEEVKYEPPGEILDRLSELNREIEAALGKLRGIFT